MKMVNEKGEAVYFNPITKNGKDCWIIQGIGSTVVIGRNRQKCNPHIHAGAARHLSGSPRLQMRLIFPLEKRAQERGWRVNLPYRNRKAHTGAENAKEDRRMKRLSFFVFQKCRLP